MRIVSSGSGVVSHLGETVGAVVQDVQDLIRGEFELARLELDGKIRQLVIGAVGVVGGALIAFAGLVVALEGGAAFLTKWLSPWASLLIVGLAIVLIGGLVARIALKAFSLSALAPQRTIVSVRHDMRSIREGL